MIIMINDSNDNHDNDIIMLIMINDNHDNDINNVHTWFAAHTDRR
jgi:hypothetical protein